MWPYEWSKYLASLGPQIREVRGTTLCDGQLLRAPSPDVCLSNVEAHQLIPLTSYQDVPRSDCGASNNLGLWYAL